MIAEPVASSTTALLGLESGLRRLYDEVRQSVVLVFRSGGNGAGTIWSEDGLIVTNNHVVNAEGEASVVLADGRKLTAIVADRHPTRDLALLKVAARDLPAITPGDSTRVRPGQIAVAIGHPNGFRDSMTFGIVVAMENAPYAGKGARNNMLLTDAAFGPGNSGGPVVDASGSVIGICSRVAGKLGMSVPISVVQEFVDGQRSGADGRSPDVTGVIADVYPDRGVSGLVITRIDGRSGLGQIVRLGDIILSIDDRTVHPDTRPKEFLAMLTTSGESRVEILRGGSPVSLLVPATPIPVK